ncbi:helix-turn-helix domain-containing protein [Salegentibacter chungangensis]|uniref:Helix-turn-helix domain-containing protein n=1 Tax=Salegentibacter chungangensis TaxID=1335724 RepID=A0ABW3NLJ3_9FLAO
MSVKAILERMDVPYKSVSLGKVEAERQLSYPEIESFNEDLKKVGFELVQEKTDKIAGQIKAIIIEEIYKEDTTGNENLSAILSSRLHYDYSHLSGIFTKVEGQSIQSFQNKIRTERAKELLEYDELSISEIADKLGYSNAAYLSTSFKKTTGLTPSQYKTQRNKGRNPLNDL